MPKITQAEKTKLLENFALDVVNRFSVQLNVNLSPPNYFIIPNTKNTYMYHHLQIKSKGLCKPKKNILANCFIF